MGCRCTGEPYDCRMGRHVATDADLPLRLVASAATESDLCQDEPHARGTHPKSQKLSGLLDKTAAQLYALRLSLRCQRQPVVLEFRNAPRNHPSTLSRRLHLYCGKLVNLSENVIGRHNAIKNQESNSTQHLLSRVFVLRCRTCVREVVYTIDQIIDDQKTLTSQESAWK